MTQLSDSIFCRKSTDPRLRPETKLRVNELNMVYDKVWFWFWNQWWHQKFFVGGIEGAKCNSEGAKIKKFAENG